MSAYMVDREHIIYLVKAAISKQLSPYDGGSITWYHNKERKTLHVVEPVDRLVEVAQMLWDENLKSINSRYPDTIDHPENCPGPIGEDFTINPIDFNRFIWGGYKPSQVLGSIACYEYQSCKHDEWPESDSYAFVNALKEKCIAVIRNKAEWGAPKPMAV